MEREAIRRIFWYIHLLDLKASIYFKKPITFTEAELRLRLPVDETSFELGVHSTLPGKSSDYFFSREPAPCCPRFARLLFPQSRFHHTHHWTLASKRLLIDSLFSEYLYLPAVRTQNASEFGHLVRIITIYAKMETTLDELNG